MNTTKSKSSFNEERKTNTAAGVVTLYALSGRGTGLNKFTLYVNNEGFLFLVCTPEKVRTGKEAFKAKQMMSIQRKHTQALLAMKAEQEQHLK